MTAPLHHPIYGAALHMRRYYVVVKAGKPLALLATTMNASPAAANEAAKMHGKGAVAVCLGASILPPTDEQIMAVIEPEPLPAPPAPDAIIDLDETPYRSDRVNYPFADGYCSYADGGGRRISFTLR